MALLETQIAEVAERLRHAQAERAPIAPLRDSFDLSIDDAYAVQNVNTEMFLSEGRHLCGRKIGVTSKAVQSQLGVHQPDYGMLFADMAVADGDEIPAGRLIQPRIEGEIAFVLGRDLDRPQLTLTDVMNAVDYALAAIEVVDSRIADWKIGITDTIADNASSGVYVLGSTPVLLHAFDHRMCGMVIEHRGEPVCTGAGLACLGNPLNACLWLAQKMVDVGRPLQAGDLVLSGALGPLTPITLGEVYELRINGLGSVRAAFGKDTP